MPTSFTYLADIITGREGIERGHRTIFDTIYKGSRNEHEGGEGPVRAARCAIVFILGNLTWYLNGAEQHIQARPTLVVQKQPMAIGRS